MTKIHETDHPIHDLFKKRWSPYQFSSKTVSLDDLRAVFEAARWAASSYNEQPWSFIVARKENPEEHEKMISCLLEGNQVWAKHAPVLILTVVAKFFKRNGKENKAAFHDLGAAAAQLSLEATNRGLYVHQMIGIDPNKAREVYQIPGDLEPFTALALGYQSEDADIPESIKERDRGPKARKPQQDFIFSRSFGSVFEE